MKLSRISVVATLILAACNTTGTLELPVVEDKPLLDVTKSKDEQASFVLRKIVANIRRGTTIAHFPAAGVEGAAGHRCNYRHQGKSTIEWGRGGSRFFGDWRSELGEVFYDALTSKGLKIAGDPGDLFGESKSAKSAEYIVGARITKIAGNFCENHHWWDAQPLDEYSGEMYVDVEWTVISNLSERKLLTTKTQGYYLQEEVKKQGISLTFQEAFANAAENMLASKDFVALVNREVRKSLTASAEPVRFFVGRKQSTKGLANRIDAILPAVVTIRLGGGHGSGFVISRDGLVLTNEHVVADGKKVAVVFENNIEVEGEVLRRDVARDVALIKIPIRVPSYLPLRLELPDRLEKVFVIGTPLMEELKSTTSSGVVSGLRRDTRTGQNFIQSDAAISGGNSGGPMLDENGNVIGISVLSFFGARNQALNHFIPIKDALEALNLKLQPKTK